MHWPFGLGSHRRLRVAILYRYFISFLLLRMAKLWAIQEMGGLLDLRWMVI